MGRSENRLLQSILNSIHNGILAINAKGRIEYFNQTAERIFDIPVHEALHRPILEVLPNTGGKLLECLKTANPFHGEKLKGQKVTLISNIDPVIEDKKIIGVVSVFQDISEIENISKELDLYKDMKNWLDAVIDSSYDGLWICDCEGKVIRINRASERINNIKAEDVVGKSVKHLIDEGLFDKAVSFEVLKKRTAVTVIQKIKTGKKILITGSPIFNEMEEITHIVINERDINQLDKLRSQLRETESLAKCYVTKLSELELKEGDLSEIVFRSKAMEMVYEMALKVAKVNSTVLLLGESGVGKGMIARLIHKHSNRSQGAFIRVDCAGIPDSLIESELFGYEKGAFTGAKTEGKPGLFELANGGTLFLDEIGEIPLSSQTKLLRFLEGREVLRVGGVHPKNVDVRVLAATNVNIDEMVASKKFRSDLYYRLNVVPISIPPLKDRRDDILPLILHFLEKFNRTYEKRKVFAKEALEVLCKHDYPGNIRELSNIIERILVTTEKDRIKLRDLPTAIVFDSNQTATSSLEAENIPLKHALKLVEKSIIEKSLRKYGSQSQAAKILKVDQTTISRKIKGFRLDESGRL